LESSGVLVIIETSSGETRPASMEAITPARDLAGNGTVTAVVLGSDVADAARTVAGSGVDRTIVIDAPALATYTTCAYARAIGVAIEHLMPAIVMAAGTTAGRDLGPFLAARAGAACVTDCVAIRREDAGIVATRPVYQGKMLTEVRVSAASPIFVVVRPGVFAAPTIDDPREVESLSVEFRPENTRVRVVGAADKPTGAVNLEDAEVIVVGGRGVGSAENFALVQDLADAFGAPVGATRAVTDLGWRPHYEQIGQTGKTVKPRLYIGVGVSGAVQHTVGMQHSETVVVINRDPDAPLFRYATVGIVGDLNEVVPALAREVRAAKAG
jgi:electron transfer flavoprotein alpha subunit